LCKGISTEQHSINQHCMSFEVVAVTVMPETRTTTTTRVEEVRELLSLHDRHSLEVRHRRHPPQQPQHTCSNMTDEETAHDYDDNNNNSHQEIERSDEEDGSPLDSTASPVQRIGSGNINTSDTSLPINQTNVPRVCCAILASITTGGTTYAFGLYGGALKKSLHLTQSQLDTISAVFFSAGLLSFIPGGFADRYGTRLGISIGGISGALSLLLFWVVSKGWIPLLATDPTVIVLVLSTLSVGIFLSCALVTGSVFKIISCQCGAGSKGSAVGVAKGFVGLGVRFGRDEWMENNSENGQHAGLLTCCLFLSLEWCLRLYLRIDTTTQHDRIGFSAHVRLFLYSGSKYSCLVDTTQQGKRNHCPGCLDPLAFSPHVWLIDSFGRFDCWQCFERTSRGQYQICERRDTAQLFCGSSYLIVLVGSNASTAIS
jgi:hypothetical protein